MLDARGIDRTDFTLDTTALEVLRRVIRTLTRLEGLPDNPLHGIDVLA
jgi:hypothetical protein